MKSAAASKDAAAALTGSAPPQAISVGAKLQPQSPWHRRSVKSVDNPLMGQAADANGQHKIPAVANSTDTITCDNSACEIELSPFQQKGNSSSSSISPQPLSNAPLRPGPLTSASTGQAQHRQAKGRQFSCEAVTIAVVSLVAIAVASIGIVHNTLTDQSNTAIDDQRIWLPVIVFSAGCVILLSNLCTLGTRIREEFNHLALTLCLFVAAIGVGGVWIAGLNPCGGGKDLDGVLVANASRAVIELASSNYSSSSSCQAAMQHQSKADCIVKEKAAVETEETTQCHMIELPTMCTDLPKLCAEIDREQSGTGHSRYSRIVCEHWPSVWNHTEVYATYQDGLSSFDVDSIDARWLQVRTQAQAERSRKFGKKYRNRGTQPWNTVDANGIKLIPNDMFDAFQISETYGECFSSMNWWPEDAHRFIAAIVGRLMCDGTYKFCDPEGMPRPTCPGPTRGVINKVRELMISSCDSEQLLSQFSRSNFHQVFEYLITTMRSPASKNVMASVLNNIESIVTFGPSQEITSCNNVWYSSQPTCLPYGQQTVNPHVSMVLNESSTARIEKCEMSPDFHGWVKRVRVLNILGYVGFLLWSFAICTTISRSVKRRNAHTFAPQTKYTTNGEGATIIAVMVLSLFLSGVLLWARYLAVQKQREPSTSFAGMQTLESSQLTLLLSSLLIALHGVVNSASTWVFRNADISIAAHKPKSIYERRKSNVPQARTHSSIRVCANSCILYIVFGKDYLLFGKEKFDSWFSLEQGPFFLELVFALEFAETVNQVIQLHVFSAERPFEWVSGLCSLLLLNTAFAPAPFLVSRYGGSSFASRIVASMLDLTLDTLYLVLNIVLLNIGESLAGDDWLVAVFGLMLPAFGALKTLHEVFVTTSILASNKRETLLDSAKTVPSKACVTLARRFGYLLVLATVATSIVFTSYFLVVAHDGRRLCEAKMGEALTSGSYPLVVLDSTYAPCCRVDLIESIDAPLEHKEEASQQLRLNVLPLVLLEMKRLERIDVSGHNISTVPLAMLDNCTLPLLDKINLTGNPVAQKLDLSVNADLKYVPGRVFDFFPNIHTLDVRNTSISCLPQSLAKLRSLKSVVAEHCPIQYVPPNILIPTLRNTSFPNTSINLRGTPVSRRLDWSSEFTRQESLALGQHLHNISYFFPDLEELNLAENHLRFSHLPDFNRWQGLRRVNLSRNEIESAPWALLQDMTQLEALDLSWNRMVSLHFQMNEGGITCRMLERFRSSLQSFDVRHNNMHYVSYGQHLEFCVDASPFIEQKMLTECPQGAEKVLLGTRELVRLILPSISGISYGLVHASNGSATGCFPKNSKKRISLGRGLTLGHIFSWADHKILRFVELDNHPSGPLPSRQILHKFQNLTHLSLRGDFRPGNLSAEIYELKNLIKFSIGGFPDPSLNCVFDCNWPNNSEIARYEKGLFRLPVGIKKWQKLETFRYSGEYYYGDYFVEDLFNLPRITKIEMEQIYFENVTPQGIFGLVKRAPTLNRLSLKANRGPHWNPMIWPDLSLLNGTSLKSLHFKGQNLVGSNNTLQRLSAVTGFNTIDLCDNRGLKYPTPNSQLAADLREKVFYGPHGGAEMTACISSSDAEAGNVGVEFQQACHWTTASGQMTNDGTSSARGAMCSKAVVYGRNGQIKNESTTTLK
jgi:hypothetical protein